MLLHISTLLYFICFWLLIKRRHFIFIISLITYSVIFSKFSLNEYFFSVRDGFYLNPKIPMFVFLVNMIHFFIYRMLSKLLLIGIIIYSAIITSFSTMGLIIPLNPLILYYQYELPFLPQTNNAILNLFIINMIPAIFASNILILLYVLYLILSPLPHNKSEALNKKLAIIQVGLYFKNGGTPDKFYNDLKAFLIKNNVDLVVFSENVFFGYKNDYIKKNTLNLLQQFEKKEITKPIIFNFYGYKQINNITSVFVYNNSVKIRQKNILIPFIEKKGFFDKPEKITSSYLNVDKDYHFSSFFSIPDLDISTFICYESLFPKYTLPPSNLTIIQSDYSQLNKGPDYYNTVFNGSILSKFSVSINRILINIQNYGGTAVIYNDWSINWDVFNRSKKEHFLTVDI